MDEFEFNDKNVKARTTGRPAQSFSHNGSSSQVTTSRRRKRHRLNYGSSKLPCRNKDIAAPLSECGAEANEPHTDTNNNTGTLRTLYPIQEAANDEQGTPKSSYGTRPSRRRRKNAMTSVDNPPKPYEIFAAGSPHSFSSPSSFLSSLQSSESSMTNIAPSTNRAPSVRLDSEDFGSSPIKTSNETNIPRINSHSADSPLAEKHHHLAHPENEANKNPDHPHFNDDNIDSSTCTSNRGEEDFSMSSSYQRKKCRSIQAESDDSKALPRTKTFKRSKGRHLKLKSLRDENVFEDGYDNNIDEEYNECSQSSFGNNSITSTTYSPAPTEKIVTRARTNVFVAQDAGSSRLILDDCSYFCSSFLSVFEGGSDNFDQRKHNYVTADAACDLAIMLSSQQNRRVLAILSGLDSTQNIESQGSEASSDQCVLDSVMAMLSFVPDPLVQFGRQSVTSQSEQDPTSLNHRNQIIEIESNNCTNAQISSCSLRRTKTSRKRLESAKTPITASTCYDEIVLNALGLIVHFLSLDCSTNEKDSAMTNCHEAREFRGRMLRDKEFLCGVTRLVLMDNIVSLILSNGELGKKYESDRSCSNSPDHHSRNDMQEEILTNKTATDPTQIGRKKRRRKVLSGEDSNLKHNSFEKDEKKIEHDGDFDFSSVGTPQSNRSIMLKSKRLEKAPSRLREKLSSAESKIMLPSFDEPDNHASEKSQYDSDRNLCDICLGNEKQKINPGQLALSALHRILTEKVNKEDDELDHNEDFSIDDPSNECENGSQFSDVESDISDVEKSNLSNPMIFKNVSYRRSGSIPLLVQAMTECLEAVALLDANDVCLTKDKYEENRNSGMFCIRCMKYLRDRILCLSSIIDGISCMSHKNRKLICRSETMSKYDCQPILVPYLLKSISFLSASQTGTYHDFMRDIGLACLRTLTSLTHENDVAGVQMTSSYVDPGQSLHDIDSSGSEIVVRLLYDLVRRKQSSVAKPLMQHTYDATIFCLNILTNTLESSSESTLRSILSKMKLPVNNDDSPLALVWLARWIVSQTEPFQEILLSDSFVNKNDNGVGKNGGVRDLEEHEDEYLITAGNGFIFLTYLIRKQEDCTVTGTRKKIKSCVRDLILSQIPGNKNGDKILLMVNALKAFCNFYRFSIGDLSVAVVAPVLKLISELETMQKIPADLH